MNPEEADAVRCPPLHRTGFRPSEHPGPALQPRKKYLLPNISGSCHIVTMIY